MSKINMADEQYTALDEMNIPKLKVPDLKRELKARGLNTSGNKMELVQRLSDAVQSGKHTSEDDAHASPDSVEDDLIDEDDVLNDDEIEQEVENISTIELDSANRSFEAETTEPKISKSLKRKISEPQVPKDAKIARKIVLNRNLSTEIETKSECETSPTPESSTTNGNGTLTEKKVIKLSELSAKERLEMRAKKFGVPLTGDAKKEVRAQRFGNTAAPITSTKATITFGKISAVPETQSLELLKKRAERFGTVSTALKKVESVEKLEKRKARFGNGTSVTTVANSEDQKAKRLERFKPT